MKGKPYQSPTNPYQQIFFRASQNNPYWVLAHNFRKSNTDRTFGTVFFEYQVAKGLTANYRAGLDNYTTLFEQYNELGTGPNGRSNPPSGGQYILSSYRQTQINSNFFLSYKRTFLNDFVLNAIAGNELFDVRTNYSETRSSNFAIGNWANVANGSTLGYTDSKTAQRVVGFYGNANVGYKEMAYLNVSARNDYASNLPSGNRSFLYPSVGLSFILTEAIPSLEKVFSFAKLRATYAEVGQLGGLNVNGVGYSQANVGFQFPYNGVSGYQPANTSIDPNLRPQNTTAIELGTELKMVKDRVSVDYTYYRSLSDGQIFGVSLAPSTGYDAQTSNAGKMLSRGHEIVLRLVPIKTSVFNWDFNVNFSKYKNTVEELPNGISRITLMDAGGQISTVAEEGQVYASFYGRAYQREPGTGRIVVNNVTGIPLQDPTLKLLGTPNPDFELNFINSFRYKSLTVGFQVDWRQGGKFYSMLRGESLARGLSSETLDRDELTVIDGVKGQFVNGKLAIDGENDIAINKTRNYWNGLYGIAESNLQDASFVRLREVSVNFDLPASLLKKTRLSAASVFLSGRNLLLITNTFVDPELNMTTGGFSGSSLTNSVGIEWYQQPQTRSIGGGVRLKF